MSLHVVGNGSVSSSMEGSPMSSEPLDRTAVKATLIACGILGLVAIVAGFCVFNTYPLVGGVIILSIGAGTFLVTAIAYKILSESSDLQLSDYVQEPHHQALIRSYKYDAEQLKYFFNRSISGTQPTLIDIFGSVDHVLRYPLLPLLDTSDCISSMCCRMDNAIEAMYSMIKTIMEAFVKDDVSAFHSGMNVGFPFDKGVCIVFHGKITTSSHCVIPFLLFFISTRLSWNIIYTERIDQNQSKWQLEDELRGSHPSIKMQRSRNEEIWSVLLHNFCKSNHIGTLLADLIQGKPSPYDDFRFRERLNTTKNLSDPIEAKFISQATMQICSPSKDTKHSADWDLDLWNEKVRIPDSNHA